MTRKEELIVGVYVDDSIVTGAQVQDIEAFKREMAGSVQNERSRRSLLLKGPCLVLVIE
jgi:hypothetical protein